MNNRWALLVFLTAVLLPLSSSRGAVLRVSQKATGPAYDGQTWQTAYLSIADAVAAANTGDELWVVEGVYIQPQIEIAKDLSIYGGFAGMEADREARDAATHISVIQADRAGSSALTFVAGVGPASVIDGFAFSFSSGIYCFGGSPTVSHNVFGDAPSAINGYHASPRIISNQFVNLGPEGWAIAIQGGNPFIHGNSITDVRGGGVLYLGTNISDGPTITANIVSGAGFTPIHTERGRCYITDNLITANHGGDACGIYATLGSGTIANNTVVGNSAAPNIPCFFIASANQDQTVSNNLVAFNTSGISATIASPNTDSTALFSNCVFSNNGKDYVNIKDATGFQGNISVDPQLVSRNGDYHLAATSQLIDAGNDTYVPFDVTDVAGNARIQGAHVDIGAYEFGGSLLTMGDVAGALRLWGGLCAVTPDLVTRLNVEAPGGIDMNDAVRLVRKAAGLEPNP